METRTCYRCAQVKPLADFIPRKGICKSCRKQYMREYHGAKGDQIRQRARNWHAANHDHVQAQRRDPSRQASQLVNRAKARARAQGLPFDLCAADIVVPTHCPVLGVLLKPHGAGPVSPATASLDKIVPALGYVKGNVEVISLRANQLKNNATAAEHERIAAWMRSKGVG